MQKLVLWALGAVAAFVLLALLFDGVVALTQPEFEGGGRSGVIHTRDAEGNAHRDRLAVLVEDDGTLWVQSGHHFRGWYHRAVARPEVLLDRGDGPVPYTAVPIDTPEAEARVVALLKQRGGALRHYVIRALLLFADIKPVRLDPR